MQRRIEQLREKIAQLDVEGILINNPSNIYYLSGFSGSAATLLITELEAVLITDFRYLEQALEEAPDYRVVKHGSPKVETLVQELEKLKVKRLAFEAQELSYQQYSYYQEQLKTVELIASQDLVKELRVIKDARELAAIEGAMSITEQAFEHILDYIKPGVKERELALELEYFMKKRGASARAFDFIVASGERGALPHGIASAKELRAGELITFDLGCIYNHYCSDFTRTVILGEPSVQQKEIYQLVLEAQLGALELLGPGRSGAEVDARAREIIAEGGYGERFGHSLGHGLGLEVHEEPLLSQNGEDALKPGMVVTVEPGIYLPQWGGVRIEDLVVITEPGSKILTQFSKELIQL